MKPLTISVPRIDIVRSMLRTAARLLQAAATCTLLSLLLSYGDARAQGNTLSTATLLALNSSATGSLSGDTDEDFFKIELSAATEVAIFTTGTLDTEGALLDNVGSELEANADGNFLVDFNNFFIQRNLDAGDYYIKVGSQSGISGQYTLYVQTVTDAGNTSATATTITLGTPISGRIESSSDKDFYKIVTTAQTDVVVYSISQISLKGEIFGASDNSLAEDGDADSQDFIIAHTLAAGTHFIAVSSPGSDTGPYTIHVVEETPYAEFLTRCRGIDTEYDDPLYGCQWHLKNTMQNTGSAGQDINVEEVWAAGNLGEGVNVAVVDTGIDPMHEDLRANIVADRNHDYTGDGILTKNAPHGTNVAGVIAALDNNLGGRGVAPKANIYSYNLLLDKTSINEADAMTRNMVDTAVSNNSWGPSDSVRLESAPTIWELAIDAGITQGFNGKGVFYTWAGGNGHDKGDGANLGEYGNYYGVTAVCSINDHDLRSSYSETGPNLWICAPSDDTEIVDILGIVTTEVVSRYTDAFGGTSSSAPTVAGAAALLRKAYPDLTWRDLKLILAASARKNDATNSDWQDGENMYRSGSEQYSFNHEYGFGVLDTKAALDLASGWKSVPSLHTATVDSERLWKEILIPDQNSNRPITETLTIDTDIEFIEFVKINTNFNHVSFRNLEVTLRSPSGAVSTIAFPYASTEDTLWRTDFRFGSAKHLGENPSGVWTLTITDKLSKSDRGTRRLGSWGLKIYGHRLTPNMSEINLVYPGNTNLRVEWDAPDYVGSSSISSYDLRYIRSDAQDKADANWTEVTEIWTSGILQYTLSSVDNDVEYDVQVRAVNEDGGGLWSATSKGTPEAVSSDATLKNLELSGIELDPPFASDLKTYEVYVLNSVDETTVTATKNNDGATLVIAPTDADSESNGHQVTLVEGTNTIVITVTAANMSSMEVYTVRVVRPDSTIPTVSLATDASGLVNGAFDVTITFSEAVMDFTREDVYVDTGRVENLDTTDNTVFTASIAPSSGWIGDVTVMVNAGVASDLTGNPNMPAPEPLSVSADTVPPSVLIYGIDVPTNGGSIDLGIAFYYAFGLADPVTGFELSDISVTNGTASNLRAHTVRDGYEEYQGVTWFATITPALQNPVPPGDPVDPDQGNQYEVVVDVPAGSAKDLAGNPNLDAPNYMIQIDPVAPNNNVQVILSHSAPSDTVDGPFHVRVEFSENVSGLTLNDFFVEGGQASDLRIQSGRWAFLKVTPASRFSGNITVRLQVGAVTNSDGQSNLFASLGVSFEPTHLPPRVQLVRVQPIPQGAYPSTRNNLFDVYFRFDQPVAVLDSSEIVVTNGRVFSKILGEENNVHGHRVIIEQTVSGSDMILTVAGGAFQGSFSLISSSNFVYTIRGLSMIRATAETVVVNIPDDNLRGVLEQALDKWPGDDITAEEMAQITYLDLRNTAVSDLTGLEYAINLADLYLDLPLPDLGPLETLKVATHLTAPPIEVPQPPDPTASIELSSDSVIEGETITATMTFDDLELDPDAELIFRADVVDADGCEGQGIGVDRHVHKVDENPEVRAGTISVDCPAGDYTIEISISSPENVELASASADFTVEAAPSVPPAAENLTASISGDAIVLNWEAPADDSVTGYQILRRRPELDESELLVYVEDTDSTATAYADSAVEAGVRYVYRVKAINDAGIGEQSNFVNIRMPEPEPESSETPPPTETVAPAASIELSSSSVAQGEPITATMTFDDLVLDPNAELIFRADVVDADGCEGDGIGVYRHMHKVDENPEVRTGTISGDCPAGNYTIEVSVSSSDDVELASATASFTVTAPPSDDATLRSLVLSGVDFGAFDPATTGYTAGVANDVERATVTATTNEDGATYVVQLYGVVDADGTVELAVGKNPISVVVTAEDGETARIYTVTVTRAASPLSTDATLKSLALSDAPFTFASDTTSYDVNVSNGVDQTTVTATANGDGASYVVKLGDAVDEDGTVELSVGSNVLTVEVTAEDGNTAKTYTVTVNRDTPPSTDATLSGLALSGVNIGTFDPATTGYNASVANDVDETTVTATANDGGASHVVKLGDAVDEDGTVELSVGANAVSVVVTAEDGKTTKTYTVTVNRDAPPEPEPAPESTGERGAWLESNPENKPFVGEWQHFTLRGNGLDKVDLQVNVIGFDGAPSSTGAVGYATASPPPAAGEACESAYFSGYQMSVDATFSLVGCREGTVILELLDPDNDWALLKRYTVTVNSGP